METIAQYLADRWSTLSKAPEVFLLSAIVVGVGCYGLIQYLFKTRLETRDSTIAGLKEALSRKDELLTETREQLAGLRTEQAAALAHDPPAPEDTVPEAQVASMAVDQVRRDVTVSEALAFVQFRQWHLRFLDAAGTAGNRVTEHLDRLVQLAADAELTIWGKLERDGVWRKIDPEFWLDYRIEWFGLLRSEARTESRRHDIDMRTYHELMVSRAEIERLFPAPIAPTMIMSKALAPPIDVLRDEIREARKAVAEMDASDERVARIRQTMSSLQLSDDPVWSDASMHEAREDLLRLWERLEQVADVIRKDIRYRLDRNYFRTSMEKSEVMMEVDDAVKRLEAGLAGLPVPSKQFFGA
jgi:hypothetical protein